MTDPDPGPDTPPKKVRRVRTGQGSAGGRVYGFVPHVCREELHRTGRLPRHHDRLAEVVARPEPDEYPAAVVSRVCLCLDRLGLAARDIIEIKYIKNLSHEQMVPRYGPTNAAVRKDNMGSMLTDEDITEADGKLAAMEAEANKFAAELLTPEAVVRARADGLRGAHGCHSRGVLGYRLASELLVSGVAMKYRLKNLGVGDGE